MPVFQGKGARRRVSEHSPHVELAMAAIDAYVREGRVIDVPQDIPDELRSTRAGAFVSLKKEGDLRGCIGTIEPVQESLAEEIISNAISAAARDPRFLPVEEWELKDLTCSVDVLMPAEEVSDLSQLDPKRYGVIVESGLRRGLLLPDLEGVNTAEEQIDIARRKAFINANSPINLYRFEVVRYR
jgi:AmmeMemoRadiSam system protein A